MTEDVVFTAKYNATVNRYTYKFVDDEGNVLKQEKVDKEDLNHKELLNFISYYQEGKVNAFSKKRTKIK